MTSTYYSTDSPAIVDFSYNDTKYQQYPYQHQEQEIQEQEEYCYTQYDMQVVNAVAEADYQDYYCNDQYQPYQDQDDYMDEYQDDYMDEYQDDQDDGQQQYTYDYRNDSLLSLVVGVQSYLTEQAETSSKCDSPLFSLQYKMYTYMRQRAVELGVQF